MQKREVYNARNHREAEFDLSRPQEADTPRPQWHVTLEWKQVPKKTSKIQQEKVNIYSRRTHHQGVASNNVKLGQKGPRYPAVSWQQDGANSHDQVKRRMKLESLFDLIAADACQATVVICTVTQDVNLGRFEGATFTDNVAVESTWEPLQLLLPWDVWETCQSQIIQLQNERRVISGNTLAQVRPSKTMKSRRVLAHLHFEAKFFEQNIPLLPPRICPIFDGVRYQVADQLYYYYYYYYYHYYHPRIYVHRGH